jgi:GT2 family glycosyltransferase
MDVRAHEVLVVDASEPVDLRITDPFPWVAVVPFPDGARHLTRARNEALLHVSGDIIAFLDDDAYPRAEWATNLAAAFGDPTVTAVAGRTCNGQVGEADHGPEEIGRLFDDGQLTGNFAADVDGLVDVDHGIGANMAFRRTALAELGGFRDDYLGVGATREDTDIFLRVRAIGGRAVFAPGAVVDHVGAPHVTGKRFDWRYMFWIRRNHALLLARNFGLRSPQFRRWLATSIRDVLQPEGGGPLYRRAGRVAIGFAALAAGLAASLRAGGVRPRDPRRLDAMGRRVTTAMQL